MTLAKVQVRVNWDRRMMLVCWHKVSGPSIFGDGRFRFFGQGLVILAPTTVEPLATRDAWNIAYL